ncbi:type II secretion system minor pseudopilin GspJ [Halioxenophilus aromaticivorans]|uniref:Type II secretion system protein J n=1 Tax=Halioxenophilus aromaticivorans TaxID=1306992 RepID=A0AAV3U5R3_9ALTE
MNQNRRLSSNSSSQGGFTLLEVLVAFAIGMLLVFLAYQTLSVAITGTETSQENMAEVDDLSRSMYLLEADFRNLINRDTRLYNVVVPGGFSTEADDDYNLKFIRAGRPNPGGLIRSALLQVGYRWDPDTKTLFRDSWPETIDARIEDAQQLPLMEEVEDFSMRFLPADAPNADGPWLERWPDEGKSGVPAAVEVNIETARFGKITRLIVLENG